jgi:hypothetical protein
MNWLRNKRVRAGAEVSLVTSATMPNSGTKSVDNSQGSSAAVSELVSGLDFVLDEWDCEGKLIISATSRLVFDDALVLMWFTSFVQ